MIETIKELIWTAFVGGCGIMIVSLVFIFFGKQYERYAAMKSMKRTAVAVEACWQLAKEAGNENLMATADEGKAAIDALMDTMAKPKTSGTVH